MTETKNSPTKPNEPACTECSRLASRVEELEKMIAKHSEQPRIVHSAPHDMGDKAPPEIRYHVKDFADGWIQFDTPEGAIVAAANGNAIQISRIELQRLSEIEEMMRSASHQVTQVYGQEVSFGKVLEDFCEVERKLGDAAMLLRMFAIKKDWFEPLQVKVRDWLVRNNLGGNGVRND